MAGKEIKYTLVCLFVIVARDYFNSLTDMPPCHTVTLNRDVFSPPPTFTALRIASLYFQCLRMSFHTVSTSFMSRAINRPVSQMFGCLVVNLHCSVAMKCCCFRPEGFVWNNALVAQIGRLVFDCAYKQETTQT